MDLVIGLPIFSNQKDEIYELILVINDQLRKMVYYKLVKVIMDTPVLAEVIIKIVVRHYGLSD